jgi:DNA segregation ATPase FtsK/SpoIIIE, S-DNA-T family
MAARTNSQQTARTEVKAGGRAAATPRAPRSSGGVTAPTTARRAPAGGQRKQAKPAAPTRKRELIALVLFGVSVFLFVVLLAGGTGGVLGRGSAAGLTFAFGHLALVVPLILLVVAVTTVLEVAIRRSAWFAGGLVFLFGLFLLVAAGAPPFGGHGIDYFVRAEFQGRAGGLGEAFYALFHALAGAIGVGIIGWVTVLAGLSLATGMTAAHLAKGTRRAAGAVRDTAGRSMTLVKNRSENEPELGDFDFFPEGGMTPWAGRTAPAAAGAPRLGPVDLVGESFPTVRIAGPGENNPFGQEFDEWSDGRAPERSPLAPATGFGAGGSVLDGARAFADIYGDQPATTGGAGAGSGSGAAAAAAGAASAAAATGARAAAASSAAGVLGAAVAGAGTREAHRSDATETHGGDSTEESIDDRQEVIPGLRRAPRQIALPVEQPAYVLPDSELLRKSTPMAPGHANERDTAGVVLQALAQFGVDARVVGMVVGPRVTRYELQLAPGTKVAKVSALKDDLAYALATTEIRILAPIPGKSAVGVEVPNQRPDFVTLGDIYREFPKGAGPLHVWLGKDISGKPVYADLSKLPHLLIAGTTGSGKSGCVNCIVSSILLRSTPEQVRLIMIDPKKVELSHYDRIPHLLVPVVTNMKDAAGVLHNVAKEMEDRYELMELEHSRSLGDMNKARARRGERPLPYILIVIDELADLMMVSPQEVEEYVIRLAQKSRAVGIHLVVATQRPSADVITGMIKANIPSRIAFAVSSQTDSRVILDVNGAETLLGLGDMLFKPLGSSHLERVQGAFITEEEIALLVNHWRHQGEPEFREELLRRPPDAKELKKAEEAEFDPDSDDLLADAAQLVIETGSASVSMLQRRLRVGYTRAGRLIDMLERRGVVGPWEGSKPRQILVDADEVEHVMAALRLEGGDGTMGDEIDGD